MFADEYLLLHFCDSYIYCASIASPEDLRFDLAYLPKTVGGILNGFDNTHIVLKQIFEEFCALQVLCILLHLCTL